MNPCSPLRRFGNALRLLVAGACLSVAAMAQVSINSGGPVAGAFTADAYYTGGTAANTNNAIDTSAVVNAAPQAVYQSERWGAFTYTIKGLTSGTTYTARLHFAEIYFTAAGQRKFNVSINGTEVLNNFDIIAAAGGAKKAIVKEFPVTVTGGQVVIAFAKGTANNPKISGIEISGDTPPPPPPPPGARQINAGGPAVDSFVVDQNFVGGAAATTAKAIDITAAAHPAPMAVYKSERWGACTYTIPNLTAGTPYLVRLHFAEIYHNAAGLRKFNVSINGEKVLSDFDIFAQAGASNKAISWDHYAPANEQGQIVIAFTVGSANQPKISGIEVKLGTPPPPPAAPSALTAKDTSSPDALSVALSWTASPSTDATYKVYRSTTSGFTPSASNRISLSMNGTGGTDGSLESNTTYYYLVTAVNEGGESAPSNESSATTGNAPVVRRIPVSKILAGNNVWMNPSDTVWNITAKCGLKIIRIGGIEYDNNFPSNGTLTGWVNRIKAMGAEPMIQVSSRRSAADAAAVVNYFNKQTNNRVQYWNIGNEPWIENGRPGDRTALTAKVAGFVKSHSSAMKTVDPTITIYAPDECDYFEDMYNSFLGGAQDITGKDSNGRYYIDGIVWHRYVGGDLANNGVKDFLTRIQKCKARVDYANVLHNRVGKEALGWGIGEFNAADGGGVNTFGNGQMFGAVLGYTMEYAGTYACTWSMFENGGSGGGTDFSFIDGGMRPRASYYHLQMISNNFSGFFVPCTTNFPDAPAVRAYGCVDTNKIVVMIINTRAALGYTVRLNKDSIATGDLKVNADAGLGVSYSGNIGGTETQILVFDAAGTLKNKLTYNSGDFSAKRAPKVDSF